MVPLRTVLLAIYPYYPSVGMADNAIERDAVGEATGLTELHVRHPERPYRNTKASRDYARLDVKLTVHMDLTGKILLYRRIKGMQPWPMEDRDMANKIKVHGKVSEYCRSFSILGNCQFGKSDIETTAYHVAHINLGADFQLCQPLLGGVQPGHQFWQQPFGGQDVLVHTDENRHEPTHHRCHPLLLRYSAGLLPELAVRTSC